MKDKTVVITGATSGLGRATALQLVPKGAFVVIIARSHTKANEVIKEIKKRKTTHWIFSAKTVPASY
jgi:short-subunit dehydrogenase